MSRVRRVLMCSLALLVSASAALATGPTTPTIPDGLKPDTMATSLMGVVGPYVVPIVGTGLILSLGAALISLLRRRAAGAVKRS